MKKWPVRRILLIVIGAAIVGALVYAFLPKPVPVDVATVTRGPLHVTVDEDGKTRIKERYRISAPLAGRLRRITVDPGDDAFGGQTLLATIEPRDPDLLDPRARAEAQARVDAARAALEQAQANLARAAAMLQQAKDEHKRQRDLDKKNATTPKELADAAIMEQVRQQEHRAAEFATQVAKFQLKLADAALLRTLPGGDPADRAFEIHAPCNGRVLRVFQKSEGVVAAGTPLIEYGDPSELEVVIDVLSVDAVKIKQGDDVLLEQWGGDEPLKGKVRVVEPAATTKVSALGVEEQRVNIVVDFAGPPQKHTTLGDGYRVEARIIIWRDDNVLQAPTSALFRDGEKWAVFVVDAGHARLRTVKLGRQNTLAAQILEGINENDTVIVHPSDRVKDGVRVELR